jgi:hypothetical protein
MNPYLLRKEKLKNLAAYCYPRPEEGWFLHPRLLEA